MAGPDEPLTEAELNKQAEEETARLEKIVIATEAEIMATFIAAISARNYMRALKDARIKSKSLIDNLHSEAKKWTRQAVPKIHKSAVDNADAMIKKAGGTPTKINAELHNLAIEIMTDNIEDRLEGQFFTIGRRVDDIYRKLAMQHIQDVASGKTSWKTGARNYLKDLTENGITGFTDKAGRKWNMRHYTETVIRTGVMETHLEATATRLKENGYDLIKISTHSGACAKCIPWQGKILSLSGDNADKCDGSLQEARDAGLFHVNCRHAFGMYIVLNTED